MSETLDLNLERIDPGTKDAGHLWYPIAEVMPYKMRTRGKYAKGYPQGAVVHYTAGPQTPGDSAMRWGKEQGYCFLLIDSKGVVHQAHPINEWGYHAGQSSYPGLPGTVSDELIGIEIACAGKVEEVTVNGNQRFKAWYHKHESEYFGKMDVRYSAGEDNIEPGWYQRYTPEQEHSLVSLLKWLKNNDPTQKTFSYDFVVGHDEVSPKRKQDPGASLSMSMPAFRAYLHKNA